MNVSSVVNHFPTANKGFITTLGSTISSGAVTVPLTSVSGLTNGTIFVGIIEPGQANEQEFTGTVDTAGVQITGVKWTDGTNVDHTAGVTIVDYVSATGQNMQTKGLLVEHNQDGTHDEALITSRTEDTDPDPDADFVLTYDTSATALKKAKLSNLGGGDGWVKNVLPGVSSVTANGNRSYTVAFDSTVASTLSEGMRLRTTRTSAATTNAFSLDGSNDYYNDTTVSGMTFTDDFSVSAWVYVTAYQNSGIAGRFNGTSGWLLSMDATGQIKLAGYNGGSGNYSFIQSYQSVPLNRWVHVAAQLDMSAFTNTTTTSYVMIDGVNVPALPSRAGTNPTALVQAGNLEIGSYNGGLGPFPGYLDQVAIYSAKVTQATILASINQGLTGSETSLISAYANGSTTDLNTTNANNLSAQNGATTVASAPWGNRGASSTLDYALVMAVSGANVTVQVPEGCTIPTTGGVSAVAYSTQANPYGFVSDGNRWEIYYPFKAQLTGSTSTTQSDLYVTPSYPTGNWKIRFTGTNAVTGTAGGDYRLWVSRSTAGSAIFKTSINTILVVTYGHYNHFDFSLSESYSSPTPLYLVQDVTGTATSCSAQGLEITATPSGL